MEGYILQWDGQRQRENESDILGCTDGNVLSILYGEATPSCLISNIYGCQIASYQTHDTKRTVQRAMERTMLNLKLQD